MVVAMVGSRTWADRAAVAQAVAELAPDTVVLSGGAPGADRMAVEEARRRGLQVVELPADWSRGKSAGPQRNEQLARRCDRVIAFWDGKSRGTQHMIAAARRLRRPVQVVTAAGHTPTQLALEW